MEGLRVPSEQLWTLSLNEQTHASLLAPKPETQSQGCHQPTTLVLFAPQIITANPWNTIALLCGAFLALFKAAEFAKLSVKWMIKIRKRYLKRRGQATNHIS